MFRFRKWFRYTSLVTGGVILLEVLRQNDWDVGQIGLVRFGRAATTVAQIAIDYKLSLVMDPNSDEYQDVLSDVHWRSARKLLDLCCVNGGVFIKVGQHIGALEYLLPYEYVTTMKVLHSSAPKSALKDILRVIREDLKEKAENIFMTFEREPLGAASLAQVHKATLTDGTVVAVKVQHPHVLSHSYIDIKTMELLINIISYIFPEFKFMWLAEESKKNLPLELQFLLEGKNAENVAKRFQKYQWLKIPKIYWKFSTNRVLTMEYCEGGQINDHNYMINHDIDTNLLSKRLGLLYSDMIFVEGFVHCDPHPGNLLIEPTTKGPQIILLDHGLYQTLSEDFRMKYCNLWLALISANVERIKQASGALGVHEFYGLLAAMVAARSWSSIQHGIEKKKLTATETDDIRKNAARFFPKITQVLDSVPREMILIFKTNDLLRGIEYSLKRSPGTTFVPMTQLCLKASYLRELNSCDSTYCRFKIVSVYMWTQFRVAFYNVLLQIWNYFHQQNVL
uniref:Protein kinase domain-containing protein n=1 Tax=Strigamia maritima TaxID=126957 RepID=T1IWN6_STRMM